MFFVCFMVAWSSFSFFLRAPTSSRESDSAGKCFPESNPMVDCESEWKSDTIRPHRFPIDLLLLIYPGTVLFFLFQGVDLFAAGSTEIKSQSPAAAGEEEEVDMSKRQHIPQPCCYTPPNKRRPQKQQQERHHVYLVVDDWERGYSVRKVDVDAFDSAAAAADLDEEAEPLPEIGRAHV